LDFWKLWTNILSLKNSELFDIANKKQNAGSTYPKSFQPSHLAMQAAAMSAGVGSLLIEIPSVLEPYGTDGTDGTIFPVVLISP